MLWQGIGNFVWTSVSGREEVCGNRKNFSGREGIEESGMRLLGARGPSELGKVAFGSAMQDLWLGDEKVGTQVVNVDL